MWCFQVVKTAQSRGRTERTLLTPFAVFSMLQLSPLFYQDGQILCFPALLSCLGWRGVVKAQHCIDAIGKGFLTVTKKKMWDAALSGVETSVGDRVGMTKGRVAIAYGGRGFALGLVKFRRTSPGLLVLGNFQPSLAGLVRSAEPTQDCVLGYTQSSLRDSICNGRFHPNSCGVGCSRASVVEKLRAAWVR